MSQNTNDAPRKPSGSSSLSGTHSPLGSPGNVCCPLVLRVVLSRIMRLPVSQVQSQRRAPLPTANSTFGVSVGAPGALANSSLSSGWQVGESHRLSFCLFTRFRCQCGGLLHRPPSVMSRRARPQQPPTLSQIRARYHFALT